jgi:hypothetical protein
MQSFRQVEFEEVSFLEGHCGALDYRGGRG